MTPPSTLSPRSRALTWLTAATFGLLGMVLFFAPAWSAPRFAWKVSDFVTMTIGAWCLGTAWAAVVAARTWRWAEVHTVLIFLWAFSILQAVVLVWFRDLIVFDALTWPYFVALGSGVLASVVGLADLARLRPSTRSTGGVAMTPWLRGLAVAFVIFVGGLAAVAFLRPGAAATSRVFPEPLSAFTVRAFGAFYLALVAGTLPILWARDASSILAYLKGEFGLLVLTTAAAFVYLGVFDFSAHPLQSLYPGAYLSTFVLTVAILAWAWRQPAALVEGEREPFAAQ